MGAVACKVCGKCQPVAAYGGWCCASALRPTREWNLEFADLALRNAEACAKRATDLESMGLHSLAVQMLEEAARHARLAAVYARAALKAEAA
jgi:hypothetical protein